MAILDDDSVVWGIDVGDTSRLILQRKFFKGTEYYDLRKWFTLPNGDLIPMARKGICIKIEYFKELAKFLMDQDKPA